MDNQIELQTADTSNQLGAQNYNNSTRDWGEITKKVNETWQRYVKEGKIIPGGYNTYI